MVAEYEVSSQLVAGGLIATGKGAPQPVLQHLAREATLDLFTLGEHGCELGGICVRPQRWPAIDRRNDGRCCIACCGASPMESHL